MDHRRSFGYGFTLIELVVVIVILGVLAAVVAPRFVDVSFSARAATVKAAAATLSTAATQANLKCRMTASCLDNGSGQSFVPGPDGTSNGLAYGYPTGRTPSGNGYWGIIDWVVLQGFTATQVNLSVSDFTRDNAPDPSNCKVRYSDAWAPGLQPTIEVTTTGC